MKLLCSANAGVVQSTAVVGLKFKIFCYQVSRGSCGNLLQCDLLREDCDQPSVRRTVAMGSLG